MQPQRAPVRPRVIAPLSGEVLPLEEVVRPLLFDPECAAIALIGPHGAGKSTALADLAATWSREMGVVLLNEPVERHFRIGDRPLPPDIDVLLLEEPNLRAVMAVIDGHKTVACSDEWSAVPADFVITTSGGQKRDAFSRRTCVIFTSTCDVPSVIGFTRLRLAPWGEDELIEHLLAVQRQRCPTIMARLPAADRRLFGGLPDVWTAVLDQLAADESLHGARAALHRYLEAQLPDTDLVERARSACLNLLSATTDDGTAAIEQLGKPGFTKGLLRMLRHRPVQLVLATERGAADLHGDADCDFLALRLPRELVQAVATAVAADDRALDHLRSLLAGPDWSHAMTASILHATKTGWMPEPGLTALSGAYLEGLRWPGAHLVDAKLSWTDLSGADLRWGILCGADAGRANLSGALLEAARLSEIVALAADLSGADLSHVQAAKAKFDDASLVRANLDDAQLREASFVGADLSGASFRGADLTATILTGADVKDTDFSFAMFRRASLGGLKLREATLAGATFQGANLAECDLEVMELRKANFAYATLTGSLLTGSLMPGANFFRADLREAKLAEIDWQGADLREADLRGATFHMGSSRCGLVGSFIPCEGSKTGFYTDDYNDQDFKTPEEIRKANLCGADLRGARIDNVDFYLVDLRGARFDAAQVQHVRRCGAILDCRG